MTITKTMLENVKKIVVHKDCPDGLASAIILHDALPSALIHFIQYGTKEREELNAEGGMLFCDMTPPPEKNGEFIVADAIVLDHHKGAQAQVEAYAERGIFADEKRDPGIGGAALACRHVWSVMRMNQTSFQMQKHVAHFALLAGIRDTWQTKDENWKKACEQAEALRFYPMEQLLDLEDPFGMNADVFDQMMEVGQILVKKNEESTKKAISKAWRHITPRGTQLMVVSSGNVSDIAEMVGEAASLVVHFKYEMKDHDSINLVTSLRSHAGYDCAKLAKHYGGGGHTAAAGFASVNLVDALCPSLNPYAYIRHMVELYEMKTETLIAG